MTSVRHIVLVVLIATASINARAAGERASLRATALIRVRSSEDARPVSGVRVTAIAASDLALMRDTFDESTRALATGTTNSDGWTRLGGLPAEKFVVVHRRPWRSNAQISEPYRLDVGEEAVLDDFRLQPPSTVFVTLSLPEELSRTVAVARVELTPAGKNRWPGGIPLRGERTASGATIEDVPAGTWTVRALGRLQNGFIQELGSAAVEVTRGADQFVTLTIVDRVYRGRVTRDGDAVTGSVNLKSTERVSGGRHAVATLAHDGTFDVLLDGGGDYAVTVQEPSGAMTKLNRYVRFGKVDDEVTIELPAGKIEGRVVDAAGNPLSGIGVSASQQLTDDPAGLAGARSGADGTFVLQGIASGTWEVIARTPDGQSEPKTVSFDSSDVSGLTLVYDPTQTIAIRVLDRTGAPLRDAWVTVELPPLPATVRSRSQLRTTNAQGTAEVQLTRADQSHPTNVIIVTPDMRLSCAMLTLDSNQSITIPAAFGEVRLIRREWRTVAGVEPRLVAPTGCSVAFLGAHSEPDPGGGSAMVMMPMSAGPWRYVEVHGPQQLAALLTGQADRFPALETFSVDPRQVTKVAVPNER
jgi:hypothetical protein